MRRFTRPFTLLIAVVAVAAACSSDSAVESSDGGSSSDVDVSLIARAADEVVDASTGRFEMALEYKGLPELDGATLTGEGEYDLDAAATRITMDLGGLVDQIEGAGASPEELDTSFETITVGTTIYMSGDLFGAIPGLDAEWIRIDLDELGEGNSLGDLGLDSLTQGQGADPSATLEQLRALGSIEEVGTEEVRGVATTHYAGDVRLGDAFDQLDEAQRQAMAGLYGGDLDAVADLTIPIDVWVDGSGLVRRVVQEVAFADLAPLVEDQGLGDADDLDGALVKTTIEYFDIGEDVTVEAPEDAVDLSELLAGTGFDVDDAIPGTSED
jgi:hypothetical protein